MQTSTKVSIFEQLGVKPVINARGHNTVLGGSTPPPRVKAAMEEAERYYVDMADLLAKSGQIVARLLHTEAAYITPGASAAMALGTAACITGANIDLMAQLPDLTGLKSKVLIQKGHRYPYERVPTIVGPRLVEVGDESGTTRAQLEAALDDQVANVLYPAHLEGAPGTLSLAEVLEIARAKGVPVLCDAACRVYPLAKITSYGDMGVDLICFGGKYVGGPNSSGILAGRKDLVEAAGTQGFVGFEMATNRKAFGRPFKLDRQEIVAVVVALQDWMATDHVKRAAQLRARCERIGRQLGELKGVTIEYVEGDGAEPWRLKLGIDPSTAKRSASDLIAALKEGSPMVFVGEAPDAIYINPITLREDDEDVVSRRIREHME